MFNCVSFQRKQLSFLDEYIKVSQELEKKVKKEEIWLLHNQMLNYLSDYLQRKN